MTGPAGTATGRLVETARDPAAPLDARHAAFTHLVQQSERLAFGLALSLLRDVEDARDATQDAFATAWHRLAQLRDTAAFTPWLNAIIATACSRRRRRRAHAPESATSPASVPAETRRLDYEAVLTPALEQLPAAERRVMELHYFLGYQVAEIARSLRLKPGTVAKRLYSARLRIRRGLPRSVRGEFVRVVPQDAFANRVRRGLLDEFVGTYRFERRPDHVVSITREGDALVSRGGGQRHVLMSGGKDTLLVFHYDGEGRFRRNQRGAITHLVYYEFGRRLGIARKEGTS